MRYATIVLAGGDDRIAPFLRLFAQSADVAIDSTRYLGPIDNGQYIGLMDLRGDLATAEELLASSDRIIEHDVTGVDERGIAYVRCRSIGLIDDLLSILYRHDIVLDWPIEHQPADGRLRFRFTVIGTSSGIQQAVSRLPGNIEFELERIGRYDPNTGRLSGILTDQQVKLLEFAVREGYYEVPRETTHRALASQLGLSVGTVSDRLQRIERQVITAYVDR